MTRHTMRDLAVVVFLFTVVIGGVVLTILVALIENPPEVWHTFDSPAGKIHCLGRPGSPSIEIFDLSSDCITEEREQVSR